MLIYIDEIIIIRENLDYIQKFKKKLMNIFKIKNLRNKN